MKKRISISVQDGANFTCKWTGTAAPIFGIVCQTSFNCKLCPYLKVVGISISPLSPLSENRFHNNADSDRLSMISMTQIFHG